MQKVGFLMTRLTYNLKVLSMFIHQLAVTDKETSLDHGRGVDWRSG